eukprot:Skav227231  [mRNA]  locus=scaffold2789:11072:16590:- [translate_table: standard]
MNRKKEGEGERRREKEGEGGRRREKEGEGGRTAEPSFLGVLWKSLEVVIAHGLPWSVIFVSPLFEDLSFEAKMCYFVAAEHCLLVLKVLIDAALGPKSMAQRRIEEHQDRVIERILQENSKNEKSGYLKVRTLSQQSLSTRAGAGPWLLMPEQHDAPQFGSELRPCRADLLEMLACLLALPVVAVSLLSRSEHARERGISALATAEESLVRHNADLALESCIQQDLWHRTELRSQLEGLCFEMCKSVGLYPNCPQCEGMTGQAAAPGEFAAGSPVESSHEAQPSIAIWGPSDVADTQELGRAFVPHGSDESVGTFLD